MNKFEKLIELIVNEDSKEAKKLFHDIVVEKSRTIYESLLDEEDIDDVEEMEDEVDADEEGLGEGISISIEEAKQLLDHIDGTLKESDAGDLLQRVAEHFGVEVEGLIPVLESNGDALLEMAYGEAEEDEFGGEEDFGGEEELDGEIPFDGGMDDGGEFAGDEMGGEMDMGGEEEIEDRVVDLEDAIDELKSEFDALIGDDGMDMDDEFGGEEGGEEMDDVEDMAGDVASDDEDGEDDDEVEESLVREYVEKVTAPTTGDNESEGTNTSSPVISGKNDMGGSTSNILGDQSEETTKAAASPKDLKGAGSFQNDPKAKAGKTAFKKKEKATNKTDSEKSILDGPKKSGK